MTGRIGSKLTTNSQCTHWVNDPSPPVSTTLVVVHQYAAIPTSSPWRVPAEVTLTDTPIRGILTSPAVGAERSLTVLRRDLEVGVPIVTEWTDEWLDRHDSGLVDYQNKD